VISDKRASRSARQRDSSRSHLCSSRSQRCSSRSHRASSRSSDEDEDDEEEEAADRTRRCTARRGQGLRRGRWKEERKGKAAVVMIMVVEAGQ
jgi:hypothetical protein